MSFENCFYDSAARAEKPSSCIQSCISHPAFYHLVLLRIPLLGPVGIKACLDSFGNAQAVFNQHSEELRAIGIKQKSCDAIVDFARTLRCENEALLKNEMFVQVKRDIDWEKKDLHHIILAESQAYPYLLKQIYDYPPLLFVIGNSELLNAPQIAMVGSRRSGRQGEDNATSLANKLVKNGFVITSGLASGIDSCAHAGALKEADNSTVAVLAHGLDSLYPKKNKNLALQILQQKGALVSEFPIGVKPKPEYFPRRNRIISGLSLGTLVVEAAIKSGSLVTAYSAMEQGREVFAMPGSINNPVARGCHYLIKSGAKLVEGANDIVEEFPEIIVNNRGNQKANEHAENIAAQESDKKNEKPGLEAEKILANVGFEEQSIAEIAINAKQDVATTSAGLLRLELKGWIKKGERGYYRCIETEN